MSKANAELDRVSNKLGILLQKRSGVRREVQK